MALMRAITMEEFEEVVKGLVRNKALGPNRFIVEFFQVAWPIFGKDILDVVKESELSRQVHPTLNSTFIALIPILKTSHSEYP